MNDSWWKQYEQWAKETEDVHERLADIAKQRPFWDVEYVIDLGCGRLHLGASLFADWGYDYIGVDLEPQHLDGDDDPVSFEKAIAEDRDSYSVVQADYRDLPWHLVSSHSVVVSLFSTELYLDDPDELYQRIFKVAGVRAIVAAGVLYRGHEEANRIFEGDVPVRQTKAACEKSNPLWRETRICCNVPSTMFGPDVIEVWRVMENAQ